MQETLRLKFIHPQTRRDEIKPEDYPERILVVYPHLYRADIFSGGGTENHSRLSHLSVYFFPFKYSFLEVTMLFDTDIPYRSVEIFAAEDLPFEELSQEKYNDGGLFSIDFVNKKIHGRECENFEKIYAIMISRDESGFSMSYHGRPINEKKNRPCGERNRWF